MLKKTGIEYSGSSDFMGEQIFAYPEPVRRGLLRAVCVLAVLFLAFLLPGCFHAPLVPFLLDTPPLTLSPVSSAGIWDGRGRFREIYCAVREDHGAGMPYDRPCDKVIWRLAGEPDKTGLPVWLGAPRLPLRVLVVPRAFLRMRERDNHPVFLCLAAPGTMGVQNRHDTGKRPLELCAQCGPDQRSCYGTRPRGRRKIGPRRLLKGCA